MPESKEKLSIKKAGVWIQEGILLITSILFLTFQIHPTLILELQPSNFLMDKKFFLEFLSMPGGLVDWLSALLMLLWFSDFYAAIIIAICLWLVALLTRTWMQTLTGVNSIHTIHIIPAGLLLVLYSQYDFRLSIIVALIVNLLFLNLIIRTAPNSLAIRLVLIIVASIILFWLTGGAFLLFALLCSLTELLIRKKYITGLLIVIVAFVMPYIASMQVFLVTVEYSYLHNSIFEYFAKLRFVTYSIVVFYTLALMFIYLARLNRVQNLNNKLAKKLKGGKYVYYLAWIGGTIFIFSGTFFIAQKTHDKVIKINLLVNRYSKENNWKETLKLVNEYSYVNPLMLSQANFALFKTGELLNKAFSYYQAFGVKGLIMNYEWSATWPEQTSEIYWNLGMINESLHWAHEAFELRGYTPWILKRLGMVYLLKGDYEAAKRFFLNLKKIPFQKKNAEELLWLNQNPNELTRDSSNKHILSCMPVEDAVLLEKSFMKKMELLLEKNPKNKLAFEFLIASHLMNGNLKGIAANIPRFYELNYTHLPIHVQEALLIMGVIDVSISYNELKKYIQPYIYNRFIKFQQILQNRQQNLNNAKPELQARFGDTYWYYFMYIGRSTLQSEVQHGYQ